MDIDAELGNNTAKSLNKISEDKVIFIHCDISKKDNYEGNIRNTFSINLFKSTQYNIQLLFNFLESFQLSVKKLGGLDILINNAGIMDENIWELEIQINVVCTKIDFKNNFNIFFSTLVYFHRFPKLST